MGRNLFVLDKTSIPQCDQGRPLLPDEAKSMPYGLLTQYQTDLQQHDAAIMQRRLNQLRQQKKEIRADVDRKGRLNVAAVLLICAALLFFPRSSVLAQDLHVTAAEARSAKTVVGSSAMQTEDIQIIDLISSFFDRYENSLELRYRKAIELKREGLYKNAYQSFLSLRDYEDSSAQADSICKSAMEEQYANTRLGGLVVFGAYEQNEGRQPIEWQVIAKENNQMMLISRYALDCQPYHEELTEVTWETCSLRNWLNSDFLDSAFSDTEQALICAGSAAVNPLFDTDRGKAVEDSIFVLSLEEAEQYSASPFAHGCKPTSYAIERGAWKSDSGFCFWWLRSSDTPQDWVPAAYANGGFTDSGYVNDDNVPVRPVLWIDLNP